jgi:hypothetical protein
MSFQHQKPYVCTGSLFHLVLIIRYLLSPLCMVAGSALIVAVPLWVRLMHFILVYLHQYYIFTQYISWTCWKVSIKYTAVNITFILIICSEGSRNGFLWPADMRPNKQSFLLHIEFLLVKVRALHPQCFFYQILFIICYRHFIL